MTAGAGGSLDGRVAVVTGGGSGIGAAIATLFAEHGARVVVVGRDAAKLRDAAGAIGATPWVADVSVEADVAALFAMVAERFGALDVLVNNAGVTGPVAAIESLDIDAWEATQAVNVRGVVLCIKHAVPLLRARGGGAIVNLSSLMGLRGTPMRSAYTASKFAVLGITEVAAQELGADRIRVNALCPGAVNGELMERVVAARALAEDIAPDEVIARHYTSKAALRRWVEPAEVARAALFLASDASSAITGERLRVDAGRF